MACCHLVVIWDTYMHIHARSESVHIHARSEVKQSEVYQSTVSQSTAFLNGDFERFFEILVVIMILVDFEILFVFNCWSLLKFWSFWRLF